MRMMLFPCIAIRRCLENTVQPAIHSSPEALLAALGPAYPALDRETRAAVDTETAAFHLSRRPQTLRCWAAYENGPIRPVRINGRLAWRTDELRRLLGVTA
jgi:hypothetical protein